jgi:branched-chain amino acid transport system ATP-binding protein
VSDVLELKSVSASYGAAKILHGVSLQVGSGEVVALLGRNGAGKSTTIKTVMGLLPITSGSVVYRSRLINGKAPFEIARLGLGYVPEDRRIFGSLTVDENLDMGRRAPTSNMSAWTRERLYELFPNLARMEGRKGSNMSGGEQQMLTIARTLMGNPTTVLLDEPSEGLSPKIVEQLAQAILQIKSQGISILLSEQNMHFASLVSDRAYVIEKGEIKYGGTMQELTNDSTVRNAYLAL